MKPSSISRLLRPTSVAQPLSVCRRSTRTLSTTHPFRQQAQPQPPYPSSSDAPAPEKPVNFYKTHGRAFFKAITLAFLTYQIAYWAWLTLETEEIKDQKNREIKSLEREVRLLEENRKGHRPSTG
ncbi:hypothetical protein LTS15_002917 [Exophiala xenobiotica]|nr:hypothetical protein LTS15_002917 [Exophiala xenobiotica]